VAKDARALHAWSRSPLDRSYRGWGRDTGINSGSARVSIYIDDTDTYRETVRAAARTAKGPCRRHPQRRRMARPCHGMIAITGVGDHNDRLSGRNSAGLCFVSAPSKRSFPRWRLHISWGASVRSAFGTSV